MKRFDYFRPSTLEEAVAQQRDCASASVLAGGTDLLVQMREHVRNPERVVDIKRIPGLHDLAYDDREGLRLGAIASTRAVETSAAVRAHYAGLASAVTHFASIQVRHRATVVGNVCRASPSADTLPPLIADGATLRMYGPDGARTVAVEDFCTGPGRTVLGAGELVTHIVVPPPPPHTGKAYIKHGRRREMELATVGVAVTLTLDRGACTGIRIALAAVGPTPIRARQAEALLIGRRPDAEAIAAAADAAAAESRPISDVRASAAYRRQMVAVLTRRAVEQALQEAA
jgi:carbon-monoxide dehydrogenase medium subunit